jgi:hypothetical protein
MLRRVQHQRSIDDEALANARREFQLTISAERLRQHEHAKALIEAEMVEMRRLWELERAAWA